MTDSQNDTSAHSGQQQPMITNGNAVEMLPQSTESSQFPEELLHHDHYDGVTIHLEKCLPNQEGEMLADPVAFEQRLAAALEEWRHQGKRGVWLHIPIQHSALIPIAVGLDFEFHMVHEKKVLILNQWLPTDATNKLPMGPTHQVGVGCFILCPWDRSKMLTVQEKTGPAAAYGLWKMPTGLSDPGEDINKAAERELWEETGLKGTFRGILIFRQAHGARSGTRASSDLFFVCQMCLELPEGYDPTEEDANGLFQACPDEIAAIQWMSIEDYCNQERWQTSPVFQEFNKAILEASKRSVSETNAFLMQHQTLPTGRPEQTNTLYHRRSNL